MKRSKVAFGLGAGLGNTTGLGANARNELGLGASTLGAKALGDDTGEVTFAGLGELNGEGVEKFEILL